MSAKEVFDLSKCEHRGDPDGDFVLTKQDERRQAEMASIHEHAARTAAGAPLLPRETYDRVASMFAES